MKTQHEHKHCKIQLHEIRSILELAFPVMQDSILHERFATFSAMQGDEPEYELMKQNLKFLNRLSFAVLAMNKHKEVYLSFDYFLGLYLDRNFNERKSFCWYELKSVLFFVVCCCFSFCTLPSHPFRMSFAGRQSDESIIRRWREVIPGAG